MEYFIFHLPCFVHIIVDIRTVEMDTCEPVVLEVNANCGISFDKGTFCFFLEKFIRLFVRISSIHMIEHCRLRF